MIRILQVVTNLTRGGIETMLMNYYRNIDRSRVQFDFLCNNPTRGGYEEEVLFMGGKVYWTPGLNPFKYPAYLRFFRKFLKDHPEYKIIHSHNDAFAAYSLFAAKQNGVPVRISHIHNAAFPVSFKLPIYYFCRQMLPSCATQLWACGKKAAAFYYGQDVLESGAVHIHNNAIELDNFLFDRELRLRIRKQYGIGDSTMVVGHVGRFMTQKNHKFILEIFAALNRLNKDSRLLLVGDGPLLVPMKQMAESLGIAENVIFTGIVSNPYDYYQAFDCFLMPSFHEGLPLSGIEAQTADLPCVFSDVISDEIDILHESSFLSLSVSPEIWAKELCRQYDSHKSYIRRNRREDIANAGYDIRIEAQKLAIIYQEMYSNAK